MNERYVIHVTKACNCDCMYCYEQDKISTYTWEEIQSFIDNLVKYNKEFGVEFLGGEPLLSFDLIKRAYYYLESMSDVNVVDYVITTNGTLLSDEIQEFLKSSEKIYFAVSLDGTRFMNQLRYFKERGEKGALVNTYDTVVENLKKLLPIIKERLSVHIVTHPYNVHTLDKGVNHLYLLGVRHIGIGTVEGTMRIGKEYALEFIKQMDFVSEKIVSGIYSDLHIDILDALKPREDVRYYIKDENGKTIGESYGRAKDDITKQNYLNTIPTSSSVKDLIDDIRELAYINHKMRLK